MSDAETPVLSSPAFPVGEGSWGGKGRSGALNHLALPRAGGVDPSLACSVLEGWVGQHPRSRHHTLFGGILVVTGLVRRRIRDQEAG